MKNQSMNRLPAEWEEQDAVLLAWPHEGTDWCDHLLKAQQTFSEIIRAISRFEKVLLLVANKEQTLAQLKKFNLNLDHIHLYEIPYNDTWARDFGPVTVQSETGLMLIDFIFNGWGKKFIADLDNQLTTRLEKAGAFGKTKLFCPGFVLEGGSIESDGLGTLLTTSNCLLEKNRNPQLSKEAIESELNNLLGTQQVHWLDYGALQGDDTDSHIDTLARFAPDETIVFQGCRDTTDEHYSELYDMQKQLRSFSTINGNKYRLLELPWPQAIYDCSGNRLPATYANFLIVNGAVLAPTYNDPADIVALDVIAQAFPHREIIPIDCCALLEQHGSLHCVTMQLPKGVLS